MNLTIQQRFLVAAIICILNLAGLLYAIFTENVYLTAYLLGFASFSTYYLSQQAKEMKKAYQQIISSIKSGKNE